MASDEDDFFTPKSGRVRDRGRKSGKRYIKRVLKAASQHNPHFGQSVGAQTFSGKYIGRGTVRGLSSSRKKFRQRRVVIKARFVKLAGAGFRKAAAHMRYVQRDGVSKEGEPGRLYNATEDDVDGKKFLEEGKGDRHQFRFIVSPEEAHELEDMKTFTRDLMEQAEKDLGTKLDYVAVDHDNTDNPHTHIIVRGVDDQGRDLVIARDYLARGLSERANELMTAELGPRQDHEIEQAMRRDVRQDRFTSIDRDLIRSLDGGTLDMRRAMTSRYAKFKHGLELARLEKLQAMGLAEQTAPGRYQFSENLEPALRALGQRGDIIKTMHAEMTRQGRDLIRTDYEIFRPSDQPDKTIIGRLTAKGLADEVNDRYYLIVEGIDGKTHYADIGQSSDIDSYRTGSIVDLTPRNTGPRQTDHTIAHIAGDNGGLYSAELHARHDPKASKDFIQTHVRRLEGLRRETISRRLSDGSWEVPGDYLKAIEAHGKAQARYAPIKATVRSSFSIEVQASSAGATWLDRTLIGHTKPSISNTGFGAEVDAALRRRQAYLMEQGLAQETRQGVRYQRGLLQTLERNELVKVGAGIAQETGKIFHPAQKGERIAGIYTKPVELVSGRYAMIEKSKDFTLVPWRSVLERARGQAVSGTVSAGGGISWDIGRKRGIAIS